MRLKLEILITVFLFLFSNAFAHKPLHNAKKIVANNNDSVQQKDLLDVFRALLKKPVSQGKDSITSKPSFTVVPAVGYTLQNKFIGSVTGNAAFHFKNANISTITASAAYSQRKQFTMPIESSIWLKRNKLNLVGDFRFYKYPQATYGLGTNSSIHDENEMDYSYFRFYEILLKHMVGNFYAGAGFITDHHWNISEKGLASGQQSDYSKYGTSTHSVSTGFTLNSVFEERDNPINPSRGAYINVQYRDNLSALGSTQAWQSIIIDARKYFHFGNSKNILAFWSYNWLTLHGKPPYLDLPSTSWDSYSSTGRGYIQGRFRGTKMVDVEAEYRYGITRNGLFGGVVFANAESFSTTPGSKLQSLQPGAGVGLRVKLNKTSKTNISLDYGFGRQGSHGLFINIGELF